MLNMLETSHQTMKAKRPKKFKAVRGLKTVRTIIEPQFAKTHGAPAGVKGKGLRFEAQVCSSFDTILPDHWVGIPGLWFQFEDATGERFAQADWIGINTRDMYICIVEVKLSRVPQAWWQLNKLYKPLVEAVFKDWDVAMVEVVSKFNNVVVPDEVFIVQCLEQAHVGRTSVMQVRYGNN